MVKKAKKISIESYNSNDLKSCYKVWYKKKELIQEIMSIMKVPEFVIEKNLHQLFEDSL